MNWMLTASGKQFDPVDPQPEMIDLVDIAHGLAHECRFAGQCRRFYSVAQHSILASQIVAPEYALEALLHDAAEAYIKDIPSPIKRLLPDYRALEAKVETVIRARFGLPPHKSVAVAAADLIMLATERRDLMGNDAPWTCLHGINPMPQPIRAMSSWHAKSMFMQRALEILQGSHA
ncbi:MAG TPA: hypothetical protein VK165_20260 [Azonexus sp.]|nr:hypothetical protein [Azonexus sp.]